MLTQGMEDIQDTQMHTHTMGTLAHFMGYTKNKTIEIRAIKQLYSFFNSNFFYKYAHLHHMLIQCVYKLNAVTVSGHGCTSL